ncbi:ABC transporter permease [Paenibacillus massiliensis]|uniref:ABC transporter permease n=1 Tax=Paenibacillus massiliensis TaxID=225917 RepID=UPI0003653B2F|nr:ABC transporter permease [Paenibacillus massiliensis]
MNRIGTVIGFTFRQKAKTKSFLITTLVLALLITIGMNIPYLITLFKGEDKASSPMKEQMSIGLIVQQQDATVAEALEQYTQLQSVTPLSWIRYDSTTDEALQSALQNDTITGYVELTSAAGEFPTVEYVAKGDAPSPDVIALLQAGLQSAKTKLIAGTTLSEQQVQEISTPVQIDSRTISVEAEGGNGADGNAGENLSPINYALVYVLMILFFTSAMMTGNMIASEVTAEKSSRIMEILITSVSPLTQMFGKIIGIFMIGMLQILVFALVVGGNLLLPHNHVILADAGLSLAELNVQVLVYGLIFYILGYFLYAVLFAAVGSIVSRTEDLGQAVMPITMLALAAFYIGIFNIFTSDTMLVKVSSFVPFTSPTVMLLRIGLERAALWEIWLSLLILVISIVGFGWLSAKIYRTGVLMYGKRPSWKELRKAMKAYKI